MLHISLEDSHAAIEEAGGLVNAVELPSPAHTVREVLDYVHTHEEVELETVGLRLRPALPPERKRAAVAEFCWLLRKLKRRAA
jgi:hypothetical protein